MVVQNITAPQGSEKSSKGTEQPYNWLTAAYAGAFALSTATMSASLVDSQQLGVAAEFVQKEGAADQTFEVNLSSLGQGSQAMTIGQLVKDESQAAAAGHHNQVSVYQGAIGLAQSEMTQNVQIAQQFSSQETNQATQVDPQATNQSESELASCNSALREWIQVAGPIAG